MKKSRILGAVCALCMFTSLSTFASPWGTSYEVVLDGLLPDADTEGHLGIVEFDGFPDLISNDVIPAPPNLPGNDLWVSEDAVIHPDGSETISVWIESTGDSCSALFCNALDAVLFSVNELYWAEGSAAVISDIEVLTTFFPGDAGTLITPEFATMDGSGSFEDPLFLFFELSASDLEGATDLHLNFTVTHVPVPAAVWLFGSALFGLGIARRRKLKG